MKATNEIYIGVPGAQVSLTVGMSGCLYLCTQRAGWAITVYEPRREVNAIYRRDTTEPFGQRSCISR